MNKNERLIFDEKQLRNYLHHLTEVSDVWADIFMFIYATKWSFKKSANLTFNDYFQMFNHPDGVVASEQGLSIVDSIVKRRRQHYKNDKYIFQSHSNRVKYNAQPVTSPAFNVALKIAAVQSESNLTSSKLIRKMQLMHSSC